MRFWNRELAREATHGSRVDILWRTAACLSLALVGIPGLSSRGSCIIPSGSSQEARADRIVRGERFVEEEDNKNREQQQQQQTADRREEKRVPYNQISRQLVDTSGIRASLSVALRRQKIIALGMINYLPPRGSLFHPQANRTCDTTSPRRPSSPSSTRGCSMNCARSLEQQMATADVLKNAISLFHLRSSSGARHLDGIGGLPTPCGNAWLLAC